MSKNMTSKQAGLSLVETMIALALGTFVIGGAFHLIYLTSQAKKALQADDITADIRAHLRQFNDTALGAGSGSEAGNHNNVSVCQFQGGACVPYNHRSPGPLCIIFKAMQLPPGYLESGLLPNFSGLQMLVRGYRLKGTSLQYTEVGPVPSNWSAQRDICQSTQGWSTLNDDSLYTVSAIKLCDYSLHNTSRDEALQKTLGSSQNSQQCASVIDPNIKRFRGWFMNLSVVPSFGENQNFAFPNIAIFQNETRVETL